MRVSGVTNRGTPLVRNEERLIIIPYPNNAQHPLAPSSTTASSIYRHSYPYIGEDGNADGVTPCSLLPDTQPPVNTFSSFLDQ